MTSKAKKPSADTIEGDAVEKPATASSSDRNKSASQKTGAGMSAGIVTAVVLALASVAVALFSLYQSQTQDLSIQDATHEQVDALTQRLATLEQAVVDNKKAGENTRRDLDAQIAQQAVALPNGEVTSDDVAKRLAALVDRLDRIENNMAEVAVSENDDSTSPSAIDTPAPTAETGTVAAVSETDNSDRLISRMPSQSAASDTVLSQAALVAVSGLLADNMAGRPVSQWRDILQTLSGQGALDFDMRRLSGVMAQNPPSRVDLLHDADQVIAAMADELQGSDVDESLLGRAGAKLGKLVNLRATDLAVDSPAGQLAAFENAIMADNFDAALQVAQDWQGRDIAALAKWQMAAQARQQLDSLIMQLVAAVLADMAEAG